MTSGLSKNAADAAHATQKVFQPPAGSLFLLLFASCILISGCSQWRYELGTPLLQLERSEVGKLNRSEVMSLLGPPHSLSQSGQGYVYAWEYIALSEDSVGLSMGPIGLEFVSMDWSRISSNGEYLLATFDANHMLTTLSFSNWSSRAGDSKSVQPLGILDGISSSDLRASPAQLRWGFALFRRLPEVLNDQSGLDSGENGIEQRATPTILGQRSLEFQ